MLKKFIYFGIGLADLVYENFDDLVRAGEDRYNKLVGGDDPADEIIEIDAVRVLEPASEEDKVKDTEADDLTAINGIGPKFAARLQEAGIMTYQALATMTAEQIKKIIGVADWQAEEWIVAAQSMA